MTELTQLKRPFLLTLILWVFIILCVLSFLATGYITLNYEASIEAMPQLASLSQGTMYFSLILLVVNTFLAIKMLSGTNWARMTYVIITVLNYAYNMITSPESLSSYAIGIVIFIVFLIILFMPKSNAFFKQK